MRLYYPVELHLAESEMALEHVNGCPNERPRGTIFLYWADSFHSAIPYWRGTSKRHPWHFPDSIEMDELGTSWMDNFSSEVLRVTATLSTKGSLRSLDSD